MPVGASARVQPRRGTFALEPVDALPRLAERIARLAERALEPNPFFMPDFLEPAIVALAGRRLRLALFSDRDDLHFFAPVVVAGSEAWGVSRSTVWAHPYAPLGSPLIDRESAPQVGDALIAHMRQSGRTLFSIPHLPLKGPVAAALRGAAERAGGFATEAEVQQRPILHVGRSAGVAGFDRMVPARRRRELDRQLRRLAEAGAVSFMSARAPNEIENAFAMFSALESSGWKGRRGTALARRAGMLEFAHRAVTRFAQKGQVAIDVLRVGDRPAAALIRFDQGSLSIPWKIAFDEEFAAYSPGKQLMCDETRRWLASAETARVDPVCEENNPLLAHLWTDKERYGTLYLSSRRWGLDARLRARAADARRSGRERVKTLLRRSKKKPAETPAG